jgi:hypothetical protein
MGNRVRRASIQVHFGLDVVVVVVVVVAMVVVVFVSSVVALAGMVAVGDISVVDAAVELGGVSADSSPPRTETV